MILSSAAQIREYTEKGWWGTDTILDLFLKDVQATPDAVAVVDPPNRGDLIAGAPQRLTYTELKEATERLAGAMAEAGLRQDDVLMVQLPNIVELVAIYLAAARLGVIVSPLPMQYRSHELRQLMALTTPRAFISTMDFHGFNYVAMVQEHQAEFPSLQWIAALEAETPDGVLSLTQMLNTPLDGAAPRADVTANDIFTICWTSGTEAAPKGVPRSHNHWIWISYASIDGCEFEAGHHLLNPFPLINMAGIGGMLVPWLLTGGKLVLHQPFDLPTYLKQIVVEKINYTVAPPALLNMLLMRPEILEKVDLSAMKNIGSGSAPLSPWMVTQWQEKYDLIVINIFGSNEGASFTSGHNEFPDPAIRAQYFPRFGVPEYVWPSRVAAQMLTKLVDPASGQEITEPGIPGELAIKGPGIFPGYYKRPDLTAKVFDEDGYFYTGDLFEIAGEGDKLDRYRFVGRVKDIINRGGVKISSEEIEGLIMGHPKVAEVAVVGYPDERMGEKLCAVVAVKPGQSLTLPEIVDYLKAKDIAVFKLPEKLLVVDRLPRNPVGKVLKRTLREQVR
ncbi:MAG: acyl--CoA ligase [Chloroflexi bacterium]|nr:acyl--CoA ligase [Chloroflexota bacterium]